MFPPPNYIGDWQAHEKMHSIANHQGKYTVRYDLTSVKMTIIKKSTNNKYWWGCGAKGSLVHWHESQC